MQVYRPDSMAQEVGPSETVARQLWAITSSWILILQGPHRPILLYRQYNLIGK